MFKSKRVFKSKRKAGGRSRRVVRRSNRTALVNKTMNPFSQRYICKMKYAEQLTQTGPSLGGLTQFTMNLNSIFDPNRTGLGHQPYGHDTLQTLYNRYRVIKCNYVISGITTGATTSDQYSIIAALPANEVIGVAGTVSEVQENPKARFITQAPPSASLKVLRGSLLILLLLWVVLVVSIWLTIVIRLPSVLLLLNLPSSISLLVS